jgi:tRNA(fMet)-specific endonuclease VapC
MNGKFLLDTNIVIALFAQDKPVLEKLNQASEIFIPSIVIGELYFGAQKSARVNENTIRIDEFVIGNTIIPCDASTAKEYGKIKNALKAKGKPIPENDIWIGAIACQHNLILISRDAHLKEIDNLKLEIW